jgi:hypothetical protein
MDMSDAAQIARGEFFTAGELAAKPWLARQRQAPTGHRADPNTRPVTAEARALAATPGVCAYCLEPGDARSALQNYGPDPMHPECHEAWENERAGR